MAESGTLLAPEKAIKHGLERDALARASGDPFPGPLAEAFCKTSITVGEWKIRKIVASDWVAFKQLNSPLLRFVLDIQQGVEDLKFEAEESELWALCWQMMHNPKQVRELMAQGVEAFNAKAQEEIGDHLETSQVTLIVRAIIEHLRRSWETVVKYASDMQEKEGITFFPDSGASPRTGSDSGSSTGKD